MVVEVLMFAPFLTVHLVAHSVCHVLFLASEFYTFTRNERGVVGCSSVFQEIHRDN